MTESKYPYIASTISSGGLEEAMIKEKQEHTRRLSYRWIVLDAIFSVIFLITICLCVFCFNLIYYENDGIIAVYTLLSV